MAAPYKKHSGSKISFSLQIEEGEIEKAQKDVIAHHKKEVSLKGFRKGEAPDDMVLGAIGPQRAFQEAFDRVITKKYGAFVQEHDLHPVAMPQVDIKDLKKPPFEVKVEVEVFPEVTVGKYEKFKPKPVKVEVDDKKIDEALKQLLQMRQLEVEVKDLTDKQAEEILGQKATVAELRDQVKVMLEMEGRRAEEGQALNKFKEKIAGVVKADLPASWIEREAHQRMEQIKQSPAFKQDQEAFWKHVKKSEEALMKDFRKDSEKTLKAYLGLSEIVKTENIELDKDETKMVLDRLNHQLEHMGHKGGASDAQKFQALESAKIDKFLGSLLS